MQTRGSNSVKSTLRRSLTESKPVKPNTGTQPTAHTEPSSLRRHQTSPAGLGKEKSTTLQTAKVDGPFYNLPPEAQALMEQGRELSRIRSLEAEAVEIKARADEAEAKAWSRKAKIMRKNSEAAHKWVEDVKSVSKNHNATSEDVD